MANAYFFNTMLGWMFIAEDEQGITKLSVIPEAEYKMGKAALDQVWREKYSNEYELKETELIKEAQVQLKEYLEGKRKEFTVKLNPKGTKFQQKVWDALRAIPYGETRSYKQIAEAVGNAGASRAVGMANHNNPIMCIIPCHRVIGANGSLVGYAGGLDKKDSLLKLEARHK